MNSKWTKLNNNRETSLNQEQNTIERYNNRAYDQIRPLSITRKILPNADGSTLISLGNTRVICTASIVDGVPGFRKNSQAGWLTAEYGMLPAATNSRNEREAVRGKQTGRTQEIQRLIGRSLRAAINLNILKDRTIHVDCDVISADGGTRTTSITGAYVAIVDALLKHKIIENPSKLNIIEPIAAISVAIVHGRAILDPDYLEDSTATTDMNIVMNNQFHLIEIQGTAERHPYTTEELHNMLDLAKKGIKKLFQFQQTALVDG